MFPFLNLFQYGDLKSLFEIYVYYKCALQLFLEGIFYFSITIFFLLQKKHALPKLTVTNFTEDGISVIEFVDSEAHQPIFPTLNFFPDFRLLH